MSHPKHHQTLVEAALEVLNAADPTEKASLGEAAATRWLQGTIYEPYHHSIDFPVPDRPSRLSNVKLVSPQLMPKLGKAGSLHSRQAILHSLVHTESWAIDLSWDIIARFGKQESMPKEFFTDFVKVAQDEGRHFTLLATRLRELGSFYGAFPAHDGLWDSAMTTSKNLLARLAIEHCVHEARGLDVLPTTITRFRNGGDDRTADLLETVVYPEEITHCAAGVKWFKYLCFRTFMRPQNAVLNPICLSSQNMRMKQEDILEEEQDGDSMNSPLESRYGVNGNIATEGSDDLETVIETFHATVRTYFRGTLKPPFNEQARKAAGFGPQWYEPLAFKVVRPE
ncbi:3-oxoacyl-acyl-carrier synthase-like protein (Protein of unknown function DUF455) isoform X2 [Tasmannia lanceolata]|uniref:3-oxoacyl-acyl-carrier synthase-like protein (Protein of unknown function DUF455) isoform X2 n=1 Tax=Tasmannia lanceolata TaxID=3420 RepID=UPI0040630276